MIKKIILSLSIILSALNHTKAQDSLKTFGFIYNKPEYGVDDNFEIVYVVNGSSASVVGILPGDKVTAVEGVPVLKYTAASLLDVINKAKEKNVLRITITRFEEPVALNLKKIARYRQLPCKDCKKDEGYFQDNIFGLNYKGQLRNSKLNGKGRVLYAWGGSPVKYKGKVRIQEIQAEFTENTPGKGTYFYADGTMFEGAILNFLLTSPYDNTWPAGAGKFTTIDGTVMEGVFDSKGNKTGTFVFTKKNGDKFECNYLNNIAVSRKEIINVNGTPLKNMSALTKPVDLVPFQLYPGGKRDNKQLWGYKNRKGEIVINPINKEPRLFKNNYCVIVKEKKLGLIDATGKIIIEPSDYYELSDVQGSFVTLKKFREGCVARNIYDSSVIDVTRDMVKTEEDESYSEEFDGFEYETRTTTAAGIFLVKKIPGGDVDYLSQEYETRYGLLNTRDSLLLAPIYKSIDEPGEGFLRVEDMDGKVGLINNTGAWVVTPGKYEGMGRMMEGMAFVRINGKYGYINNLGKEILPCTLEDVTDFKNGYATVKAGGKNYFIDTKGKAWLPSHPFKYIYEAKNNLFIVTKQSNKPDLLVNAKGASILKTEAEQVVFTPTGYAYIAAGKVVMNNGKEIKLPYDSISRITSFPNGMLLLSQVKKGNYNNTYRLDWVVDNTGKLIAQTEKSIYNYDFDSNLKLLKKVVITNNVSFICYVDDKGKEYVEMGK